MSPAECLRDLINERLTAAAEEIFSVCQRTIEEYQEEIDRQRRLLDIFMKPHLQLYKAEPPQQHVYEEEEEVLTDRQLRIQERNFSLDQDDPEPPRIKEEKEEFYTSPEGEEKVLKQETETSMWTSACQDSDTSEDQTLDLSPVETQSAAETPRVVNMSAKSSAEPEPHGDDALLSTNSHVTESPNPKGDEQGESGSTRNTESSPQKRDHTSKSHGDIEVNSTTSNIDSNAYTEKKCCKCDTCGKAFKYMSILHIHMRVHTGEKPYPCNTCEKRFSHVGTLKDHMRVHTGEKPYQCNTCEKRFSQLYTLKKHMRVHTGEKPYQCNTCEKRFSQLGNLKEHMSVHTGEKPYSCKTCGRDYRLRYQLKNHMRTHAGKRFCQMSDLKST